MNQVLLILLLVSSHGSQGKSVSNASRTFVDPAPGNNQTNVTKHESFVEAQTTESTTVSRQEDQDPIESSETVVYNRFDRPSGNEDVSYEEEDEPEGPPDHVIPYSEHEEPRNVPSKPRYIAPGEWAKPSKDKQVPLEFVPTKVYAQVRKTHTLRRLPRKKAVENAESDEEKENAARLREVVKNSKVNTVYTEEGYEDSAYDHAGQVRDADFHEGYAKKLHDHLDLKKQSENGGADNEERDTTKVREHEKVRPEQYKDFDEDYSDRYDTGTRYSVDGNVIRGDDNWKMGVNAKLIAEKGIEKLQEDLEREAEEMEKGIELSKLEKVEATTDREILSESRKRDEYDGHHEQRKLKNRKRKRKNNRGRSNSINSLDNVEKSQPSQNVENPTAVPLDDERLSNANGVETATSKEKLENWPENGSESYIYESDGGSSSNTDSEGVQEDSTTVSYGQLLWDYFKTRQSQATTTEASLPLESTTLYPNLPQASLLVGHINNLAPHSAYKETTTSFPLVESAVLNPFPTVPYQAFIDTEYSRDSEQNNRLIPVNEQWLPVNYNEASTTETVPFSEAYNDKVSLDDRRILFSDSQKSLDSHEGSNKNFDGSLFDPTIDSLINRKPRYKITIRHKPKKFDESSDPVPLTQHLSTLNAANNPSIRSTALEAAPLNENYLKVLMHLKNQKNVENPRHLNDLQRNSYHPRNDKNNLDKLTRMKPPLPQKTSDYHYNHVPRGQPDIDAAKSDRSSFPVPRRHHRGYRNSRAPQIFPNSPQTSQRLPFNRKRSSQPAFDFILPSPLLRNDPIWHGVPSIDYVTRAGNRSKQARSVLSPFLWSVGIDGGHGIRAKRRERRFARGRDRGEKGGRPSIANNGASNRGETEQRAAKNLPVERNHRSRKVTRGVEVGLVPDTSRAKQRFAVEKKSRSRANDRGEGSRAVERESSANGNEGRHGDTDCDSGAFRCDEGERKEEGNAVGWVRTKRNVVEENTKVKNKSKEHEELLDEGLKVVEDVALKRQREEVGKEVPARRDTVEEHANEGSQVGVKVNLMENETDVRDENSKAKDKLKEHEELLDEAPKVAEDVIEKEINDRFNNDKENEEERDEEKKVEIEIPEFDYVEEVIEDDHEDVAIATEATLDSEKYPFYDNEKMPTPSALRYATNPRILPNKTYGAMEFYSSRDAYKHCDEVEPNLEVLPEKEEPVPERGPNENLPRLRGLGDKLDCFRAKYFDENPFDNPLFMEKEVTDPVPFPEIDTKRFASRIMMFPKENDDYVIQRSSKRPENYRQSRKYPSVPIRVQKTRRIRYKTYPMPRTRTRKVPQGYRAQGSQVKYTKVGRRPQKTGKRPVTAASEISSLYTPYQNQVYEDVMGTIKNLANSYEVHEVTTTPETEETNVPDDTDNNVKTNSSKKNLTSYRKKEGSGVTIDIMDRPSNVGINIKGVTMSPKYRSRHRGVYIRTAAPQMTRTRVQRIPTPVGGLRTVKHRRKVRIYKRDLTDDSSSSREDKFFVASIELDSTEKDTDERKTFLNSKENTRLGENSEMSTSKPDLSMEDGGNVSVPKNSTSSGTALKTVDPKRKSKVPKTVTTNISNSNEDLKREKSQKVVYTIKDRIRYSKPKEDARKVGKFVNGTKIEEDRRRREPKYNYIRRRGPSNLLSTTTEKPSTSSANTISLTETPTTTQIVQNNQELVKENLGARYIIDETKNGSLNASEIFDQLESDLIEGANEQPANKTNGGYAVYENVNEDEATTTQKPESATPSEFFSLKTFLETDPPGYTELSSEDFKKSFFQNNNGTSNSSKMHLDSTNSNQTEGNQEKDGETWGTSRPSYVSNEESSETADTTAKVRSSTESSEEISAPSKENVSEERGTFFEYTSRPSSPAENYEDQKYSDLGPRVSKPAFFHPPFDYKKPRPKGGSEESEESGEEKEEYVFPWYRDKKDKQRRKRRYRGKAGDQYEYPWERRERLAREERRRKEEKRKRLVKSFEDDDEDTEEAFATKNRRNVYPRGRYRFWSRRDKDASEDSTSDNVESSSEYRPVKKYSSRYSSKFAKLPLDEKLANVRSRSVEEISKSIKKALEGDSEEKRTSVEKESDSSEEKRPATSQKFKGISRGMIVPEDVTLAPTRKAGKRERLRNGDSVEVVTDGKNSSELTRNSLDDSETRINLIKSSAREIGNSTNELNSTRQSNKKRRRPLKNAVPAVETTTKAVGEANRARRRQKTVSTTPATSTTFTSPAGTTSTSRTVRRKNLRLAKDSSKNNATKELDKSIDGTGNETEVSTAKTGTVEHRSRGRKKSRANEVANEAAKRSEDRELSVKDLKKDGQSEEVNDQREKNGVGEKKLINDDAKENEEASHEEPKLPFPSVKTNERFDFKDDRIEALTDFDKSDEASGNDDFELGSVLETDANFAPQNRAVQLSEQGSREIVSSVSWISENYNF